MIFKDDGRPVADIDFKQLLLQGSPAEKTRLDRLIEISDHCSAAKETAEAIGDTFLVYMISMAIHAVRAEMRPKSLRANR